VILIVVNIETPHNQTRGTIKIQNPKDKDNYMQ